jgi:uncharacterized protein (UPF0276 family)
LIALAIADKPLTRELLASEQIAVDYLETTGPFVDSAVQLFAPPLLLHNSLWDWSLAHPSALQEKNAIEITHRALDLTHAPWLSVHLGFSTALVEFDKVMQPRSRLLTRKEAMATICQNLLQLARSISVPLIIENLDYNPGGAYEYVCEPAFIAEVLNETKVGLLLDLAHSRVSAARLGLSSIEYLAPLPFEHVKEIHVSGPRWQENTLNDAHDTLLDEDYALLNEVLGQSTPSAITLEYARNSQALIEQLERLHNLLQHH